MTGFGRMRRIVRLLLVLAVVGGGIGRVCESRRLEQALARDPGAARLARLDAARLLDDVRTLAAERFDGRRTGTDGGRLARAFVAERFEALRLAPLSGGYLQPFTFTHTSIRALWRRDRPYRLAYEDAANVLGMIRGRSRPDAVIVVSAHYDHLGRRAGTLFPGADDNASGVAALLAMAAWFQAHPPEHSLLFAAFDAEELGLRGARAFVDSPLLPQHVALDLNLDMLARGDHGRLFVAGTWQAPWLRPYVEQAARRSAIPVHLGHDRPAWLTGLSDDWTGSSDHAAFHARGLPFLYFGVEDHVDYHAPGDTFERISRDFFVQAAETVLDTLLAVDAGRPADRP